MTLLEKKRGELAAAERRQADLCAAIPPPVDAQTLAPIDAARLDPVNFATRAIRDGHIPLSPPGAALRILAPLCVRDMIRQLFARLQFSRAHLERELSALLVEGIAGRHQIVPPDIARIVARRVGNLERDAEDRRRHAQTLADEHALGVLKPLAAEVADLERREVEAENRRVEAEAQREADRKEKEARRAEIHEHDVQVAAAALGLTRQSTKKEIRK